MLITPEDQTENKGLTKGIINLLVNLAKITNTIIWNFLFSV